MANHPNRSLPPLAKSLKDWRARASLGPDAAAERLGVGTRQLEDWEQRARSPRTNLAILAAAYIDTLDRS